PKPPAPAPRPTDPRSALPGSAGQTSAGVLAKPFAPAVVPGGTPPVDERHRADVPGVPHAATVLREAAAQMTLDVLVYSDQAEDRMVFINGRKYVEGEPIVGGILVVAIIPQGAVLSYEGQQFLLRPKSNPYLRSAP
ncbi:MAG: general secretion pathway protein GspB, partial [Candidatus Rokuibacteriota bacterium]